MAQSGNRRVPSPRGEFVSAARFIVLSLVEGLPERQKEGGNRPCGRPPPNVATTGDCYHGSRDEPLGASGDRIPAVRHVTEGRMAQDQARKKMPSARIRIRSANNPGVSGGHPGCLLADRGMRGRSRRRGSTPALPFSLWFIPTVLDNGRGPGQWGLPNPFLRRAWFRSHHLLFVSDHESVRAGPDVLPAP